MADSHGCRLVGFETLEGTLTKMLGRTTLPHLQSYIHVQNDIHVQSRVT
jgi:hypothetical protein